MSRVAPLHAHCWQQQCFLLGFRLGSLRLGFRLTLPLSLRLGFFLFRVRSGFLLGFRLGFRSEFPLRVR